MKKLITGLLALMLLSGCAAYVRDAQETTFKETKASTLLKRYEWFKNAAAQLDKKQADIRVWESRIKNLKEENGNEPRIKWAREDREQYNLLQSELSGIMASYNQLASEYNSAMAKINYAYTNVGELPQGAEKTLPREYRTYQTGDK